jgi:hypothetical protein
MTLPAYAQPFGLRDVKLIPLGADGSTPGTSVDLPAARTFSFTEAEDFEVLRGDDEEKANHGSGPRVEWDLEGGGISLEAYAVIAGGTVTSSGTTPAIKKTFKKLVSQQRPYFKVEGQAISDNGGDFHGLVYKAKATDSLEGSMEDGSFWLTAASGTGIASTESANLGALYDFVHNETAVPIP